MNKFEFFVEHLNHWESFLNNLLSDGRLDDGQKTKYRRQLFVLSDVLLGVPFNIELLNSIIDMASNDLSKKELSENSVEYIPQKFYNDCYNVHSLDESGKNAVIKALNSDVLFLIQGPPGTGKTTVITEIIAQSLSKDPELRIVLASETHIAVDNAIERLNELIDTKTLKILRYPKSKFNTKNLRSLNLKTHISHYEKKLKKFDPNIAGKLLELLELDEFITQSEDESIKFQGIHKLILESFSVIGITCNHMGRFYLEDGDKPYDLVIVDEVSKATLPEIFLAITNAKKVILVGDPNQLPPTFCKEEIEVSKEMEIDIYEKLINDNIVNRMYKNAPESQKAFLSYQYRMTNEIGDLVSTFYNNELNNGRNVSIKDSVIFIDYFTKSVFPKKKVALGGKLENYLEAEIIYTELIELEQKLPLDTTIAVITAYKAQKRRLTKILETINFKNIEIDTIDAFQGRQAQVVFFSVTRNSGTQRFFSDPRRLNVAISRAEDYLYIVGSKRYLKNIPFFQQYLKNSNLKCYRFN